MLNKIKKLIRNLPKEDVIVANAFIDSRDFESLGDLVDSSITRIKKNLRGNNPKEEYKSIDRGTLIELKSAIDSYMEQLILPDDEEYS